MRRRTNARSPKGRAIRPRRMPRRRKLTGSPRRRTMRPSRLGLGSMAERLTAYEKLLLQRYHATILTEVLYPGMVTCPFQLNFVDQRLSAPKTWRDVYRHDDKGNVVGWVRYDGDKRSEF